MMETRREVERMHRQEDEEMRVQRIAELKLIRAAVKDHRGGCAPEACGGSRLDPCELESAIDRLAIISGSHTHLLADIDQELNDLAPPPAGEPELLWVPRRWRDVVTGDTVRMPGTEITAIIERRYLHPSEDPHGLTWHVTDDGTRERWSHTRDHVVQPGECVVALAGEAPRVRFMDPGAAVEIRLSGEELKAIEMLGWENRLSQKEHRG